MGGGVCNRMVLPCLIWAPFQVDMIDQRIICNTIQTYQNKLHEYKGWWQTHSLPNCKSWGAEILRGGWPSPTCHVWHVMSHVPCVMCHVSHFMCHYFCAPFFCFAFFLLQIWETSWWRVFYQRGYLVYVRGCFNCLLFTNQCFQIWAGHHPT